MNPNLLTACAYSMQLISNSMSSRAPPYHHMPSFYIGGRAKRSHTKNSNFGRLPLKEIWLHKDTTVLPSSTRRHGKVCVGEYMLYRQVIKCRIIGSHQLRVHVVSTIGNWLCLSIGCAGMGLIHRRRYLGELCIADYEKSMVDTGLDTATTDSPT